MKFLTPKAFMAATAGTLEFVDDSFGNASSDITDESLATMGHHSNNVGILLIGS